MDYLVILEVASRIRKVQNKLYKKISDETGVHYTALEIIVLLYDNNKIKNAKEICQLLSLKPNLVSFHIDKLVNDGFLIREPINGDRRKIKLSITDKCTPIGEYCNKIRKQLYEKFTNGCTSEEIDSFYKFILKLKKNTEATNI